MSALSWGDLMKDAGDSASGGFEPLPDGDYDFKIVEATASQSSSGKTMFKIKAQVQGGAFNSRLVWDNLVVSPENPNALGFFFRKMSALGLTSEFFNTNPTNAQIEQALQNRSFRGKIGSRTWQGQKRNEFKSYAPPVGGGAGVQQSAPAPQAPAPVAPAPQAAPAPQGPPAPPVQPQQQDPWGQQPQQPQWGAAPVGASGQMPPAPPF